MLIYKYVNAPTLSMIIANKRVAFTHPRDFNDPFDRPRVSRAPYHFEYRSLFDGRLMTREAQAEEADVAWNKCAVSSFTRTYDNALMWAHYADKHTGAVIEFDAVQAGLMSTELLIPVQFGSVIYLKRPMPDREYGRGLSALLAPVVKRGPDRFDIENYEGLQRLFLTKSLEWAYEEEVRAVSDAFIYSWNDDDESLGGHWKRFCTEGDSYRYGLRLPPGSITRVFAGLRFRDLDGLRRSAEENGFDIMRPVVAESSRYEIAFATDKEAE